MSATMQDTDKLAAMGVVELIRCGVTTYERDAKRVEIVCDGDRDRMSRRVRLFIGKSETYVSFALPTFRKRLAKLFLVPDGDFKKAENILLRGAEQ